MKRGMVFTVVFCMLFSLCYGMDMPVLAADGGLQKVTLSLNSNTSDSASIDLYLRDSVHYITIDDPISPSMICVRWPAARSPWREAVFL